MCWGNYCGSGPIRNPEELKRRKAKFETLKTSLRSMGPEQLRQIKEKFASKWPYDLGGRAWPFERYELAAGILREIDQEIRRVLPEEDTELLEKAEILESAARDIQVRLECRREEHPTWVPDVTPALTGVFDKAFEILPRE